MRVRRVLLLAMVVGLLGAGCGGEDEITIGGQRANDRGTDDVSELDAFEFEMGDYYFAPTVLRGDPGQSITLEPTNESDARHNLSIPEQRIDVDVAPNGRESIRVRFPQSGLVAFFCKYHQGRGMRGGLEVTSE